MSVVKNKKIIIDGKGFRYTGELYVNAILGIASADAAICKITDIDNDAVYEVASSTLKDRHFPLSFAKPQYFHNLYCEEFTNMVKVIVYVDRFGTNS